jgi:4-alpha-glucanotransferase
MEHGAHTTYAAYRLLGGPPGLMLRLRLLANARDHHGESPAGWFSPEIRAEDDRLCMAGPGRARLHVRAPGGRIVARHDWYRNFDLAVERERGLPSRDDHLLIGEAELDLAPGRWVGIVASLAPEADPDIAAALACRRAHDRGIVQRADARAALLRNAPDWVRRLVLTADSFLFARPLPDVPDGESVIAGYPWFGDWGRDTMISLPGLTLATGRHDSALRILETFARFVDRGMLPNVFPGAGQVPDYNTVDASLWYVEAWRAYVEATGDFQALARVLPILEQILEWHRVGTRYGIALDPADGLLRAGEAMARESGALRQFVGL